MTEDIKPAPRPAHSPELDKLLPALKAARDAMGKLVKNKNNPHYKSTYADLAAAQEVAEEHLHANGLIVTDTRGTSPYGWEELVSTLWHMESAQWMRCYSPINPARGDMHGVAGATTYFRRHNYLALVGLSPEDDDGNGASKLPNTPPVNHQPPQPQPQPVFPNESGVIVFQTACRQSFKEATTREAMLAVCAKLAPQMEQLKASPSPAERHAVDALRKDIADRLAELKAAESAKSVSHVLDGDSVPF